MSGDFLVWRRKVVKNSGVPMQQFFAASTRGLLEAQAVLDECGRASLVSWEEEGLPPQAWNWSECYLSFTTFFTSIPKSRASGKTGLQVSPVKMSQGKVAVRLYYRPTSQVEEETD